MIEQLKKYMQTVLATDIEITPVPKTALNSFPYHITHSFSFSRTQLYGKEVLLLHTENTDLKIGQLKKQLDVIAQVFTDPIVLIINRLSATDKKRLIETGIPFIVPNEQLFLPQLLIHLKEEPSRKYQRKIDKLTPSAQCLLLFHFLNQDKKVEQFTFKQLAKKLDYTAMSVTKAVALLEQLDLCTVQGTKEKYLHFKNPSNELWKQAVQYLSSPVLKRVFVDELPAVALQQSHALALAEYTNMAPDNQLYYAIDKQLFYALQKTDSLVNLNEFNGKYMLEVWKYNPNTLAIGKTKENYVDPLSLYLSLCEEQDERIEMALDQILEQLIW